MTQHPQQSSSFVSVIENNYYSAILITTMVCNIHLKSARMNYMMNLEKKIPLKLELKKIGQEPINIIILNKNLKFYVLVPFGPLISCKV
jgi:hypothetical protein